MDRKANRKARIGVYTTGLKAYWPQFKGLKERLEGYGRFIAEKIAAFGDVEVFNFGLVDCSDRGIEAGEYFQSHNVDLVFSTSALTLRATRCCPSTRRAGRLR